MVIKLTKRNRMDSRVDIFIAQGKANGPVLIACLLFRLDPRELLIYWQGIGTWRCPYKYSTTAV